MILLTCFVGLSFPLEAEGVEKKKIRGMISLTTLLEIRYLLRRKKKYTPPQIEAVVTELTSVFEIIIPDEISLLEANTLQSGHLLDPFDSILLGLSVIAKPSVFISRDAKFLRVASDFLNACTPEKFVEKFL